MEVITARSSGFCFGVKNAVDTATRMTAERTDGEKLVMLGELTHNAVVVGGLVRSGFEIVEDAADVPEGSTVIIRAHGVTPAQKEILISKGCRVVDCTCPFVQKIHDIVRENAAEGRNVIIAGTKGHPEVVGICGETSGNVAVISSETDLDEVPFDLKESILISQTTFSSEVFKKICANAENKIAKNLIFDTICSTTGVRQREAMRISSEVDVMIVIGSSHSSNTKKLYDICSRQCVRTFLVNDSDDVNALIREGRIKGSDRVGITAGASTPEVIILEVVRRMDENKNVNMTNQNEADIDFQEYVEGIAQLRRNAIVKGAITSADADYVYVDVRDKSEGKIPRKEFDNDPDFDLEAAIANKSEVTVIVKSIKNTDQGKEIILSKSQVDYEKNKGLVQEAFDNKTPITVTVTSTVKDGVIATYNGIDIYIHRTQLKIGEVTDLDEYKGQKLEILVTKMDTTDKHRLRISGSRRTLLLQERKAKAEEVWENIEVGKRYKGIVRSLPEFGAFVDIGGVDGLVHITELSWKRIRRPSDVLKVGDEIEVYVKSFDKEAKKISLGYKREEDDPYYNIEERIPVGSVVKGTVVRLTNFGAFVQLEPDLDALCHVSQISTVRLNQPSDVLSVGQEVIAKVIDIKPSERRISISIKEVQPIDPAEEDPYEIAENAAEASSEVSEAVEEASEAPAEE